MACFLIPTTEAIVVTVARKVLEAKEKNASVPKTEGVSLGTAKLPFSRKLKWLEGMLWGGSALLAFEHVWHGEVVPYFPFLTAMQDPESTAEMLHEMATAGVGMAVLVTAAWLAMVGVSALLEKKAVSGKRAKGEDAV